MSAAPIALFVYNRPWHASQTLQSLQNNVLAQESDLFVFSDASKNSGSADAVQQVRDYLKTISGFKSITIHERVKNLGLANSIIDGVTYLTNKFGRVIVLEDDMVSSPHFLTYMNEALNKYASDERVISIHGYVYPTRQALPEAFFLKGADCWGWATWQRGWALFNHDGKFLLNELRRRRLTRLFDFNGTYPYTKMLEDQIEGRNDSWAIRWYASAFLAEKLTLYPGSSLIQNIGNDSSGTHCGSTDILDVELTQTLVRFEGAPIEQSQVGWQAFHHYFRSTRPKLLRRALQYVKRVMSRF